MVVVVFKHVRDLVFVLHELNIGHPSASIIKSHKVLISKHGFFGGGPPTSEQITERGSSLLLLLGYKEFQQCFAN